MTTPQHAATSRSREAPQGDEEASSELRLGEFQNVDALTHSEAALVINALVAKRRVDRKNVNETEYVLFRTASHCTALGGLFLEHVRFGPTACMRLYMGLIASTNLPIYRYRTKNAMGRMILQKTTDYLEHFARFRRKENVEAVERLLTAHKELAKFERAQLGSLCCDTAEEAKTLIPSLTDKITDDDLQELLDEITKLMGYGN
ncbi:DNA-directed RNA polymerase II subunit [Lachnellula occidentalis]|uniref:DNA-directed RNA polymerase II subunit n=1 Tax=Lachnellula occidentalis TaxID=215460 RepID=A0A8H8UGB8_9HELO|nr:DNA-directed RNA polymerase II subunit [Lachnellula occidentalis]